MLKSKVSSINIDISNPTASSQAQSQSREILRPPPLYRPVITGIAQNSSLGASDEQDSNVIVKSEYLFCDHCKEFEILKQLCKNVTLRDLQYNLIRVYKTVFKGPFATRAKFLLGDLK